MRLPLGVLVLLSTLTADGASVHWLTCHEAALKEAADGRPLLVYVYDSS